MARLIDIATAAMIATLIYTAASDYRHRDDPEADIVSFTASPIPHEDVR